METAQDRDIGESLARLADGNHGANVGDPPSFHPFPARMPLPLAEYLLKALVPRGARVLDPMMGSGSTLVAARKLGHAGQGVDIDPLAVLISRSATASYQRWPLDQLGAHLLSRAEEIRCKLPRTTVPTMLGCSEEGKRFLRYWFPNNSQRELYCLAQAIQEAQPAFRNVAWAAFSSLIIAKATSVSYAIDISRSRPHRDESREINPPFFIWMRRFNQVVNRLPFLDQELEVCEPEIERGDARSLPHPNDCFDLVFTSPPYLNAIDYLRGHKFSLFWMGHDLASLRTTRATMIGCERGMWKPNGLPPKVEQDLTETIFEERVRATTRRYLSDLRYSMLEMKRVVRPDGLIALVLGPSVLNRQNPDSVDLVRLLAKSVGLTIVAHALRPLKKTRRSLPPPEAVASKSELASRMSFEAIVVLRKRKAE